MMRANPQTKKIDELTHNKSFEPTARLRLAAAQLYRWTDPTTTWGNTIYEN